MPRALVMCDWYCSLALLALEAVTVAKDVEVAASLVYPNCSDIWDYFKYLLRRELDRSVMWDFIEFCSCGMFLAYCSCGMFLAYCSCGMFLAYCSFGMFLA